MQQFDFGENWREFSVNALTPEKVRQASEDFARFIARGSISISGKSFLDIGFGQGLGLLSAASMQATTVGCDINPKCALVLEANRAHFPGAGAIRVVVGSILDPQVVDALKMNSPAGQGYEIVHSWGVLHHTGRMWEAIDRAAALVKPGGSLFLALYNRHWSSPAWRAIKRGYVSAPAWLQRTFIGVLTPVIFAAKFLVTGKNPMVKERGMDFRYDVIDWVGGYPYEYATRGEVVRFLQGRGFALVDSSPAEVPTGCNEFVFLRGNTGSASSPPP
jgi:2-polyprenyl-3-methyl-5-hydroxy-6-metoxy-1,4-benzoquinol methylase